MKTKKDIAKRGKNIRNNRHVKRSEFRKSNRSSVRIKSKRAKKVNSTKIGKGSYIARLSTILKRIIPLKH